MDESEEAPVKMLTKSIDLFTEALQDVNHTQIKMIKTALGVLKSLQYEKGTIHSTTITKCVSCGAKTTAQDRPLKHKLNCKIENLIQECERFLEGRE